MTLMYDVRTTILTRRVQRPDDKAVMLLQKRISCFERQDFKAETQGLSPQLSWTHETFLCPESKKRTNGCASGLYRMVEPISVKFGWIFYKNTFVSPFEVEINSWRSAFFYQPMLGQRRIQRSFHKLFSERNRTRKGGGQHPHTRIHVFWRVAGMSSFNLVLLQLRTNDKEPFSLSRSCADSPRKKVSLG